MSEDDRDPDEVQHRLKLQRLCSGEEMHRQGYSHGPGEQPEARLKQPSSKSVLFLRISPSAAPEQDDADQEHEKEGSEAAQRKTRWIACRAWRHRSNRGLSSRHCASSQ